MTQAIGVAAPASVEVTVTVYGVVASSAEPPSEDGGAQEEEDVGAKGHKGVGAGLGRGGAARAGGVAPGGVGLLRGRGGDSAFLIELVRRMAARRN